MADRRFTNTDTTDPDMTLSIQTTPNIDVDRPDSKEFWQSTTWQTNYSYYKNHNSVKTIINKLGIWTVGKGYNVKGKGTQNTINKIIGSGKETFDEVMSNQVRGRHIDGDSYAEIIGGKGTKLKNLKPLNAGAMKVYYNKFGMLDHYGYQFAGQEEQRFEKEEIFHLCLNRTGDATHGEGDISALTKFLDKIKQLDEDMATFFHGYVVPMIIWKLNTSNATEVAQFKADHKTAKNSGTDIIIPDKAVDWDLVQAGKNGIDPLQWRQTWVEEVTKGGGVPALIMAIEAGTTEASSKMVYLSWQQVIEAEQRYLEEQIRLQLGLEITFEFPARIEENLGEDEGKDGGINTGKKSEVAITSTTTGTPTTTPA